MTAWKRFASVDYRVFRNLAGLGDEAWSGLGARRGLAAGDGSVRGAAADSPAGNADSRRTLGTGCRVRAAPRSPPHIAGASSRLLRTPGTCRRRRGNKRWNRGRFASGRDRVAGDDALRQTADVRRIASDTQRFVTVPIPGAMPQATMNLAYGQTNTVERCACKTGASGEQSWPSLARRGRTSGNRWRVVLPSGDNRSWPECHASRF